MKIKALAFAALLFTATTFVATAQDAGSASGAHQKIGYTNVNYIFSVSPRAKEIESEIKSRSTILQKEIEAKEKDFQEKLAVYQKGSGTMMESIKADKENELRNLDASITNLKKNSDSELKSKYDELVAPESDKISKAIKDVAAEHGYSYIMNGDPNILLYGSDKFDVTDLVLKKLGITPPVKDDTKPATQAKPANSNPSQRGPQKVGGMKK